MRIRYLLMVFAVLIVNLFLVFHVAAGEVDENTVALWLFDEGDGNEAEDSSGNGNHGEINQAEWVEGKFGSALYFNGNDAVVVVPNSESLHAIADELTIETWVKVDDRQNQHRVFFSTSSSAGYGARIHNNENFHAWVRSAGAWHYPAGSVGVPVPGLYEKWNHIAATYDAATGKQCLYVNGEMQLEGSIAENSTIQPGSGPIHIGNRLEWATQDYQGSLDELRISNVVRTEEEIQESMRGFVATSVNPRGNIVATWGKIKGKY